LLWRIDDDELAAPDTLEILLSNMASDVGAVSGLILMPGSVSRKCGYNPIADVSDNAVWYRWNGKKEVQHLHSSFLYRRGVADYELCLSRVGHREETILSHRLWRKGYKLVIDSRAVTTHLKNSDGGLRPPGSEMFEHDDKILTELKRAWSGDLVAYLDNGTGDHVIFKSIIPELKEKYSRITVCCCYPDIFDDVPGIRVTGLVEGKMLISPERLDLYHWCDNHNWKGSLRDAFLKLYLDM
jgi:hypothetical protein